MYDGDARFRALDGWRGICALLVAAYHSSVDSHFYSLSFVRNSWLFVDFFFVLSGFVISHAYSGQIRDAQDIWAFMSKRFWRLWPLHAVVLTIMILIDLVRLLASHHGIVTNSLPFTGSHRPDAIIPNYLLIQDFGLFDFGTWNFPSWSISAEFWAYFLFAILVYLTGAAKRKAFAWAHAITAAIALIGIYRFSPLYMFSANEWGIPRCIAGFSLGCLIYRMGPSDVGYELGTHLEMMAAILATAFVTYSGPTQSSLIAPFVFAFVVWAFAQQQGALSNVLQRAPFQVVGRYSYSIYMVHVLVFFFAASHAVLNLASRISGSRTLFQWQNAITPEGQSASFLILPNRYLADAYQVALLAIIVAVAAMTYRYVERPGQMLGVRLLTGKRSINFRSSRKSP